MRLSYSGIETYKICPLKYKYREIDKLPEPKGKEAVFGTLIHSTMKFIHDPALVSPTVEQALDYFGKNWNETVWANDLEERAAFAQGVKMIQGYYEANRPSEASIIDLESRFSLEIGTEETGRHTIAGIIDRIDKTKDGYEIIDYKTARKMPSQEKVDHDLQLSIYLRAFLDRYPKEWDRLDRITVSLYYLKHGVKLSSHRTKEDLELLDTMVLEVVNQIEAAKFEPILSPLCDWCGYQKQCPLWKHKFKETRKVETSDVEQAITEFLALRAKMSTDKVRLAELQETLLTYMEQEGVERVFGPSGIVGKSIRKTYTFDEEKLRALLLPLGKWDEVLKVDGTSLRGLLPTLPSPVRSAIENAKTLEKESISLSVKRVGADAQDAPET